MTLKMLACFGVGLLVILHLHLTTAGQRCDDSTERTAYMYPRVLTVLYDGPPLMRANRDLIARSLGPCISLQNLTQIVYDRVRAYDINVTEWNDPLSEIFERADYRITPTVRDPARPDRLVTATFFDFPKYLGTPLHMAAWFVTAKSEYNGQEGRIDAGFYVMFGMMRFRMHSRNFCLRFASKQPLDGRIEDTLPVNFEVYNPLLGQGSAVGLKYRTGPTDLSSRMIITFP